MKLIKILFICSALLLSIANAKEEQKEQPVNINFKDLDISDFVKLTSKILDKNILLTNDVKGKVDFISTKPVYKSELLDIIQSILETKGFTLIDNGTFLTIVRLADASTYNLPIVHGNKKYDQMITKVIYVNNEDVNVVASKVRHLTSKSAKLVTVNENNSILITDFPENIKTLQKVISLVEQSKAKEVAFVKLDNVEVDKVYGDIAKIAKGMLNEKVPEQKVDLIPNKNSNTIVVVATKDGMDKMMPVIKSFDVSNDQIEEVTEIIALKNTEAKNIFKVITAVIKSKTYPTKEEIPSVSSDDDTNSLILIGTKENVDDIVKIVRTLDKEKPQVYVKAQIIEVNENLTDTIGAKYGLIAGKATNSGLFGFTSSLVGSQDFDVLSLSSSISGLTFGNNIKEALALSATIDFLKSNNAVNVVSEPSLLCINNKESSIYVGETKSIKIGTETTSGGVTTDKYSRDDIGLTLKIKPLISNDNKVTLEITTVLEDVKEASTTNNQPDTSKKEIKTVALVRDGENVIIGGLIKDKVDNSESKVPLLGDIPVLGQAFRHENNVKNKINLVVILTPYVIEASSNLSSLREKLLKLDKIQMQVNKNLEKYLEKKEKDANK